MFVTRSGPRISTHPFVRVDLPAPESPTRHNMIGRPARNGSGVVLFIARLVGPGLEHPARAHVHRVEPRQILPGDHPAPRDEAVRLGELVSGGAVAHPARRPVVGPP